MRFARIAIILALIAGALTSFPCWEAGKGPAYDLAAPQSTLIYGRASDATSLDPPNQWDGASSSVINNVYENLYQFKEGSTALEPVLAETCEISADLLEYTFRLRKNIMFHDGTQFDADAVIFNFERQARRDHEFRLGNCECYEANFGVLDSVRKIDDYTVVFRLKKPYAPFMGLLAMTPMAIVSPSAVKTHRENFYKRPCGTGPFKFKSWVPGDFVIIERNDSYWGKLPGIKRIVFKTIPDNKLRLMQLYSGIIHMMDGISPGDIDTLKRNPDITLLVEPGLNIGYIAMNTEKPPFSNRQVRLAVNHAINKKSIITLFYQNTATLAKNPVPPNIFGYNNDIDDYNYDIRKAREYLKLAGYENGLTAKFYVLPVTTMPFPEPDNIANAVTANLKDIGIKLEKVSCDWVTYQKKLAEGEHDLAMYVWSADIPDPDNFLYVLLDRDNAVRGQAQNVAFYRNDILHYTLMKAQSLIDFGERAALYRKAQEIIHDDAPWVPMTHSNLIFAHRNSVKNLKLSPVTFESFKNVTIERE